MDEGEESLERGQHVDSVHTRLVAFVLYLSHLCGMCSFLGKCCAVYISFYIYRTTHIYTRETTSTAKTLMLSTTHASN